MDIKKRKMEGYFEFFTTSFFLLLLILIEIFMVTKNGTLFWFSNDHKITLKILQYLSMTYLFFYSLL